MAKKLTARSVELAKPDPLKRREIPDAGKPGLYLVIQPNGKKSWAVRYRFDGRPRKVTLDGFPSLMMAHRLAQAELDKVADGRDPAAEKQVAKRARARERAATDDLFPSVVRTFIERHAKPKNRSWKETARVLGLRPNAETGKLDVLGGGLADKWGKRRIQEICKRDVLDLLEGITDRGAPIMANRTLAAIRKLFNWCVAREMIEASPCALVAPPAAARSRDRVLTDDEIKAAWGAFSELGYPFGAIAKLLLLTGQRIGEVAGMTAPEIDEAQRQWIIPRERAKNDELHVVPLSEAALQIIAELPRIEGDDGFLFTTTGRTPVSGFSRAKSKIDELTGPFSEGWTFHDLRRTVASGMARLGISLPVIEKVLNHRSGSFAGVVGVYQRHSFDAEKRAALDAWANFITALVEGRPTNVVALRA